VNNIGTKEGSIVK